MDVELLSGLCPDERCGETLFFSGNDRHVLCFQCGQLHPFNAILAVGQVTDASVKSYNLLKNEILASRLPKKPAELIRVSGLCNYHCKLVSPLLTSYGMDKQSGRAKRLCELRGQRETFDCGAILSDRAFAIEAERLDVLGYGRDQMGSRTYLRDTLSAIDTYNKQKDCLVPIHADGDGHCLVHALSRALVGYELFWHALRHDLKQHLVSNLERYQQLLRNFVETVEWSQIISECDPAYVPDEDSSLGLRNVHVFGLANVLRRPVILLDCLAGLQSAADYSGVFLPALCKPSECRNKAGVLNKPLCIAWSSAARNHYIALVPLKGKPLPRLPNWMFEHVWAVSDAELANYIDVDEEGACEVGGGSGIQREYIEKLVAAMDELFYTTHSVTPRLVCEVLEYICKRDVPGTGHEDVTALTQTLVRERRLYRCLTCGALTACAPSELETSPKCILCAFDCILDESDKCSCSKRRCTFCNSIDVRVVRPDGSTQLENGDRTMNRAVKSRCACGFKHFWEGKEYDNVPSCFPVRIEWEGQVKEELVTWFQDESDSALNSNAYDIARLLVDKHFPGRFGIERLYQLIVEKILLQTELNDMDVGRNDSNTRADISPAAEGSQSVPMEVSYKDTSADRQVSDRTDLKLDHKQGRSVPPDSVSDCKRPCDVPPPNTTSAHEDQQQERVVLLAAKPAAPQALDMKATQDSLAPILPANSSSSATKRTVLVATTKGEKCKLTLSANEDYYSLLVKICEGLKVDLCRIQWIKYGFPPRDLAASVRSAAAEGAGLPALLPVQHGDKLTVELQDQYLPPTDPRVILDMWLLVLISTAQLARMSLWTYVQTKPKLFCKGGLFYEYLSRTGRLVNRLHCALPVLDNKILCYNEADDCIELCLEPHGGHQPIGRKITGGRDGDVGAAPNVYAALDGDAAQGSDAAAPGNEVVTRGSGVAQGGGCHENAHAVEVAGSAGMLVPQVAPAGQCRLLASGGDGAGDRKAEGADNAAAHLSAGAQAQSGNRKQEGDVAIVAGPPGTLAAANAQAVEHRAKAAAATTVRIGPGYSVMRPAKPAASSEGARLDSPKSN